jgi:hypothetical protein
VTTRSFPQLPFEDGKKPVGEIARYVGLYDRVLTTQSREIAPKKSAKRGTSDDAMDDVPVKKKLERSANSDAHLEFGDAGGNIDGIRGKSIPLRFRGTILEEK